MKQEVSEFVEEMDSDDDTESSRTQDSSEKVQEIPEKEVKKEITNEEDKSVEVKEKEKKIYGPMRPPEDYVIPQNYFDQESDRDLPEIEEKDI